MSENSHKTRGRPRLDKPPQTGRWIPQVWRPEYETIVLESCMGHSNTAIAQKHGCTAQHVSNILNTPQGKGLRDLLAERLRKHAMDTVPQKLEAIAAKTVDRIFDFVHSDAMFEKMPTAVIDRGLKIMEHVGMIRPRDHGNTINLNNNRTVVLTPEAAASIERGLIAADEVKRLHGPTDP